MQDRVEDAEIGRGVGAGARDPLPVGRVGAGIGIDQRVPEPLFAGAPVDQEMLHEERGDHHPDPVVHHAGVPELAHAGVDDRVAGQAAPPGLQCARIALPGKGVELLLQISVGEVGDVEQQVAAELAPAELAQELVDVAGEARVLGGGEAGCVPELARADLAEAQMRRQARGAVAVGPVAIVGVAADPVVEESLQQRLCGGFARRPALAQPAGPIGPGRLELASRRGLRSRCR